LAFWGKHSLPFAEVDAVTTVPTTPSERVEALDILRGIALFGVMAINLVAAFRVSLFQRYSSDYYLTNTTLDFLLTALLWLFIETKALTIFTLLFGVGLAIQVERLGEPAKAKLLLIRRLLILLAIGLVHLLLIWPGDILTWYAIAGLMALNFLFGSRGHLANGALIFAGIYVAILLLWPWPEMDAELIRTYNADAARAHQSGSYFQVLLIHWRAVPEVASWNLFALPQTTALFLFGAWIWRSGILRTTDENRRRLKAMAWLGCLLGIAFLVGGWRADASSGRASMLLTLSMVALALGYSAIVIVVATGAHGERWLGWAAPVGRMAFTNYLSQSVIFALIFFGYGLGMFNRLSIATTLAIGVVVYVLQAIASSWWLRRHRFGPMEWLWRSAMYGTAQPWRR
jgi:uncharacterized protein